MFEMPLVIPLFYYPMWLGFVVMLLSVLIIEDSKRTLYGLVVGFIFYFVGLLMWFCVPGLEVVIW